MNNSDNLPPLLNFNVVAIHRVNGQPQFAKISAPSQVDADDFVADMQPDWIVVRDNADLLSKCDHCNCEIPQEDLIFCDWEDPDFGLCDDCHGKLSVMAQNEC